MWILKDEKITPNIKWNILWQSFLELPKVAFVSFVRNYRF